MGILLGCSNDQPCTDLLRCDVPRDFGCAVNLIESTHRNVLFRDCTRQLGDTSKPWGPSFETLAG